MHIALDLDDCILDFVGNLCRVVNTEFGTELTRADITAWDLGNVLDPIIGENWWRWWKERSWLWAQAPAVDGAIGAIRKLRQDGHYLEIVTSKPLWAEASTWQWLGRWRVPVQRVTIMSEGTTKADVTDAAVLVDDKVQNCLDFARAGRTALLYDRPHNRNPRMMVRHPGIIRIVGWKGVLSYVETRVREEAVA